MLIFGFRKRFALSVLLLAAIAATSKADTIYNNSAQWIAATSGVTAINFGALSPPIDYLRGKFFQHRIRHL